MNGALRNQAGCRSHCVNACNLNTKWDLVVYKCCLRRGRFCHCLQLAYPDNSFKEYSEWFMKMSMFVVNYQNYWKIVFRLGYSLRSDEYTAWYNHYVSCSVVRFCCTFK